MIVTVRPLPHRTLRGAPALLSLAALLAGCGGVGAPASAPPASAGDAAHAQEEETMAVCVLERGALARVPIRYEPAANDSLMMDGRRFREAHPVTPEYAAGTEWFARTDTLEVGGRRYAKRGESRMALPEELERAGEYRGVAVFAAAGETGPPRFLYLPVRPRCEFQPYERVQP